ncbi:aminoglycoside phosphotransferase family protein [Micromonospora sp. WMMD975]|uniref:aminoglycoside phosphotransferase family protein n=1 Tax=Micromonospora sp. WMMD975 TaxID=3016087 RepID=UPI00249B7589|nr:aminoglycoside phosphotransferase family protein [Micromonospora sp. WMMD975]WFE33945.1 aminoglycoside phosphotransferase family protein [Micromonospora sp. WMMD975]
MSGRFSQEAMTKAMREITAGLGVPADDARLLHLTNNAVFALPSSSLVIRIARTHRLRDRVAKVVRLARWFAEIDAPTIRLAPEIEQPVEVGELVATVWTYVPPCQPAPTARDLGSALREFHALGTPPFALPEWDPVGDARRRLSDADGLSPADHDYLVAWCDRLEPQVAALNQRSKQVLVHGDAHVGNLLRGPMGRVTFCDFDATCIGPWQVDLAAVAVGAARFGTSEAHGQLAKAYGVDVISDEGWTVLREARELKMIIAAVPLLMTSQTLAEEFRRRLESIRTQAKEKAWKPFSELS